MSVSVGVPFFARENNISGRFVPKNRGLINRLFNSNCASRHPDAGVFIYRVRYDKEGNRRSRGITVRNILAP